MGLKILLIMSLAGLLNCRFQGEKKSQQDLASYIKGQIYESEKWKSGDVFPSFVIETKFKFYDSNLLFKDGGLVYVNILRRIHNRNLILSIITSCDEKLDVLIRRTLEHPYPDVPNFYFDYFGSLTKREIAALLYGEKYTNDQLTKDITSINKIQCTGEIRSGIERYKHARKNIKANILLVATRKEGEQIDVFNTAPRLQNPAYDNIKLLMKESLSEFEDKDALFFVVEKRLSMAELEEPIFWQFEGPYLEDHGDHKGFMKMIFDDFKKEEKLPYFKYYDNLYGFVALVYIEKIF